MVSIMTNKGEIVVELDSAKAPITVKNFLDYVNSGFYDGTIFHRVIKGFMIQGGGFTPNLERKKTKEPIKNEANNRLSNRRGTIAMARTSEPHSATSQFFINTVDNYGLDFKNETMAGWGYCVFGRVIKGMEVVDSIENVPTTTKEMMQDVPVTPIIITKAKVITSKKGSSEGSPQK
ncbi:MAG: peptidylprolyl isomerase [Chitinispirillaceae bacterium]|nr:peptidylprolyl isomerase [Chitinispirillaceae bacterium]